MNIFLFNQRCVLLFFYLTEKKTLGNYYLLLISPIGVRIHICKKHTQEVI